MYQEFYHSLWAESAGLAVFTFLDKTYKKVVCFDFNDLINMQHCIADAAQKAQADIRVLDGGQSGSPTDLKVSWGT